MSLSSLKAALLASFLMFFFSNFLFFIKVNTVYTGSIAGKTYFLLSLMAFYFILNAGILNLLLFKYIGKALIILFFLVNSVAVYYIYTYNIFFSSDIIASILNTDIKEVKEIFNVRLILFVLLLGILPSLVLLKVQIVYKPFFKEIITKIIVFLIALCIGFGLAFINYKEYSAFFRTNNYFKGLVLPYSYLISTYSLVRKEYLKNKYDNFVKVENEAKFGNTIKNNENTIVVFIIGETARLYNFSLNGYSRDTNKPLEGKDLMVFNNTTSCGTITNISVPCMFSSFDRDKFSLAKASLTENLVDILDKTGMDIMWINNNNGGCQKVCKNLPKKKYLDLCTLKSCYDLNLVPAFRDYLNKTSSKTPRFVVLHTNGSHGPTYYLRYTNKYAIYKPYCKTAVLKECTNEEIVNAYDNTIYYTSELINKVIDELAKRKDINAVVVYISDHGESLGENGLYLHGMPYLVAPKEQKHVPFLIWMNDNYKKNFFNKRCLANISKDNRSHDNIFSTILGLFNVSTPVYNSQEDIFSSCYKNN